MTFPDEKSWQRLLPAWPTKAPQRRVPAELLPSWLMPACEYRLLPASTVQKLQRYVGSFHCFGEFNDVSFSLTLISLLICSNSYRAVIYEYKYHYIELRIFFLSMLLVFFSYIVFISFLTNNIYSLGVIEVLLNSGRQIEAVYLAYAFELTEQYAPVPLLKAYLKEARKVSQIKAGNTSPSAQVGFLFADLLQYYFILIYPNNF